MCDVWKSHVMTRTPWRANLWSTETDMWAEQWSQKKIVGFFAQPGNSRLASTPGFNTLSIHLSSLRSYRRWRSNFNLKGNSIADLVLKQFSCNRLCRDEKRAIGISYCSHATYECLMANFASCWAMESPHLPFQRHQNALWLAFFPVAETALVYVGQ
jgi:hypothetical protein